ncbi:protein NYNRIN-like [Solanum tuberosum]|uniref:protein NYNRIN-like n=1 Tax=Solanum tuberosum TaxID=4113 RepID=UPI00073A0282|nr:PREDICTED: protein NYNRIN-like [Solanum tuberosum]
MAEHEACILGLKMAIDMNVHELLVIEDSNLLIHQVQGEWPVKKNPKITPYVQRTPDLGLLKCVDAIEAAKLLEQIHARVCGTHMDGLTLAKKILHAGYFWITMEHDCCKFVQKCQIHGDLIRVPPHELYAMSSPWHFVAWGMDVIGPTEPVASNRHRFTLVSIDYFTKWMEAASHKSVTKTVVADFIRNNLICRFGIPGSIVTDNGANLNSHLMKEICEKFKITHWNSAAYRPQMNGVVEAANQNIKKILRKMIDNHKGLHGFVAICFVRL